MKTTYEVKGYTKTGIYAEVVEAETPKQALFKAMPSLRRMAFGKITRTAVSVCLTRKERAR